MVLIQLIAYYSFTLQTGVTNLIKDVISSEKIDFETICGIPYTALPISTMLAVDLDKPMVLRRKEPKSYGTKQLIEGKYKVGDRCIIVEDVISTGSSVLETADVSHYFLYNHFKVILV